MGGRRVFGRLAVFGGEDGLEIRCRQAFALHVEQGADDVADHLFEEAVATDAELMEAWADLAPFRLGDGADRALDRGAAGLKALEILGADQNSGGFDQVFEIEWFLAVEGPISEKYGWERAVPDAVDVGFGVGTGEGMEVAGRFPDRFDDEAIRRQGVEAVLEALRNVRQLAMGNLSDGMHAPVRTAGADDSNLATKDPLKKSFQSPLDRRRPKGLFLPPIELPTIITNNDFHSHLKRYLLPFS